MENSNNPINEGNKNEELNVAEEDALQKEKESEDLNEEKIES